jgi:hypothetical protein
MALDVSLTVSISSDLETSTLTDATVYGSPNPDRVDLRVFAAVQKLQEDLDATTLAVTSNTGDAETVTAWTYTTPDDGYIRFYYVAIPAYSGVTTYAAYDAVYNTSDDTVYRSKVASNSGNALTDTAYWEVISSPALLAANEGESTESANITQLTYERVLVPKSQRAYSRLVGDNCPCTDCDDDDIIFSYEKLRWLLNSALIADSSNEYVKGEGVARMIDRQYISC